MYVVANFEMSHYLELAISSLEAGGVAREKILAVPLETRRKEQKLWDSIHSSDGVSLTDAASALGTALMVIGTIYGFKLKWGPVIWALIGLAVGALIGFMLDLLVNRRRFKKDNSKKINAEVVLIVNCSKNLLDMVERVLWEHYALGVAELHLPEEEQ